MIANYYLILPIKAKMSSLSFQLHYLTKLGNLACCDMLPAVCLCEFIYSFWFIYLLKIIIIEICNFTACEPEPYCQKILWVKRPLFILINFLIYQNVRRETEHKTGYESTFSLLLYENARRFLNLGDGTMIRFMIW